MKTKARILFLTVCLSIMIVIPSPAHAANETTKALWVWDFYEAASDSNQITQLLKFSTDQDINLLFIGTRKTLSDQPATYEELITRAHEKGIRVFALVGRANWALERYHRDALEELRQVLSFNESYPSSKFDGIQYDIEPHTLPEFKTKRGSVSYQYIQVLKKIANKIASSDDHLEFNAAIPFWFATGENAFIVNTGGMKKPLSYFVLDIVDTATIMAYRDTAEKQIRSSLAEINYAAKKGKKIYIGAETSPPNGNSIPSEITYYNKGLNYMNKQLKTVENYFSNHDGFSGIAIHSYPTLKKMVQNK
ncbi:hypothetical protein SAMN04488542_117104 [Fontibacillus panacisegetis]|uniref:Uncharacterized protein n=1 Tax=Fontibacillus panacisegetis TaxID=670482 RepID=A0A1G7P3S3_9BACL|nr:hypothetical protein [Fontibacillus panacisegetis]SDF80948.1 hypothetical protein SAMN04488542_117104 [Fontibacillus panacisegetis]